MKTKRQKLHLDRETLATLDPRTLDGARGGVGDARPQSLTDCASCVSAARCQGDAA